MVFPDRRLRALRRLAGGRASFGGLAANRQAAKDSPNFARPP